MPKKKTGFPQSVIRCGQFFVYLAYRCIETLIFLTPVTICWRVGTGLGWVAYYLLPKYRRLAIRNLRIAYEGEMMEEDMQAVAHRHFATLGRNLLCSVRVAGMAVHRLEARVTYEGLEKLDAAISAGQGIMLALSHMGPWEIFSQLSLVDKRIQTSTMYQSLRNPYLDKRMRKLRSRGGLLLFDRKEGFYKPMRLLKEGGGIGILVDQHAGDSGLWCPFFGRLASTTNLASLFSVRTKSPVFPVGIYPNGIGRWKIVYEDALGAGGVGDVDTSSSLTAEMNQVVEKLVCRAPEEWFWVHNRWKTPQPHFLLTGYKRGVEFPFGFDPGTSLKPFHVLVRSPNWLGDACMAIPAVRAIKRGRPDVELTVLAPEKLAELWATVDEVDRVLAKGDADSPWKVGLELRKFRVFDVGILLPNSLRSALELRIGGVPRVVGYRGHSRKALLHQVVREPRKPGPPEHHVRRYLKIATAIGAKQNGFEPCFVKSETTPAEKAAASPFESAERPEAGETALRLGMCAGAEFGPAKRWSLERFAEAGREISRRTGAEWVLFGTAGEAGLGEKLSRMLGGNCSNLIGKTTLGELIVELQRCELLLTNDTGTMHLAAFLNVPTVSLFGSTEPALTGPLGKGHRTIRHHVECSPCYLRECPIDFRCMEAVEVEEVVEAVTEMVGAGELVSG